MDETSQAIAETRDEALLEIMGGGGDNNGERVILQQGIVDGLMKPKDNQIMNAHGLLKQRGNEASERVEGLSKLVANCLHTKNNNNN